MTEIDQLFESLYVVETQIADAVLYLNTNPQALDAGFVMSQIPVWQGYADHIQNGIEQAISAMESNTGE